MNAFRCSTDDVDESAGVRDRIWVNADRTVLVRLWADGTVEVATRPNTFTTWGPPAYLEEEK